MVGKLVAYAIVGVIAYFIFQWIALVWILSEINGGM